MPNITVSAAAPGLPTDPNSPEPILALLARWKEANARWKNDPASVDDDWMEETFDVLNAEMRAAPTARTLPGALAALQILLDEREDLGGILDPEIICGLVSAALGFLRTLPVQEEATHG